MRKITLVFAILVSSIGFAQTTVTIGSESDYGAFANVFFTDGNYAFGSGWGVGDIVTTFSGANIVLQPNFNTYADNPNDAYWRNNGGAGPLGNKIFEGNTFIEMPNFSENELTFTADVVSNTMNSPYNPSDATSYTTLAFIKALDPNNGFATVAFETTPLVDGATFSVTATGLQGFLVQYGFIISGLNANPADEATLGSVTVEPATLSVSSFDNTSLRLFPNPSSSSWNISANEDIKNVSVYNALGKEVLNINGENRTLNIDGSTLATGLYFAKVSTAVGISSLKLVKQ